MLEKIRGIDLVAITAIICFSILIYAGYDSAVIVLISTIVGYYFGRKTQTITLQEAKSSQ